MPKRRLKVMADYGCDPLWLMDEVDNIAPSELPLSPDLIARLARWQVAYDATLNQDYPPDSQFSTPEATAAFEQAGWQLAQQVQQELGSQYEIYYGDLAGMVRAVAP